MGINREKELVLYEMRDAFQDLAQALRDDGAARMQESTFAEKIAEGIAQAIPEETVKDLIDEMNQVAMRNETLSLRLQELGLRCTRLCLEAYTWE